MKIQLEDAVIPFEELRRFIVEGKKHGWASGQKPIPFRDGGKGYSFHNGRLLYQDRYHGNGGFIGQETVYYYTPMDESKKNVPLWGMNYSGIYTPHPYIANTSTNFQNNVINEVNTFLRAQLLNVPEERPFRGPTHAMVGKISIGKITYIHDPKPVDVVWTEVIREFTGQEWIKIQPTVRDTPFPSFQLIYHGRLLVPNSFIQE